MASRTWVVISLFIYFILFMTLVAAVTFNYIPLELVNTKCAPVNECPQCRPGVCPELTGTMCPAASKNMTELREPNPGFMFQLVSAVSAAPATVGNVGASDIAFGKSLVRASDNTIMYPLENMSSANVWSYSTKDKNFTQTLLGRMHVRLADPVGTNMHALVMTETSDEGTGGTITYDLGFIKMTIDFDEYYLYVAEASELTVTVPVGRYPVWTTDVPPVNTSGAYPKYVWMLY